MYTPPPAPKTPPTARQQRQKKPSTNRCFRGVGPATVDFTRLNYAVKKNDKNRCPFRHCERFFLKIPQWRKKCREFVVCLRPPHPPPSFPPSRSLILAVRSSPLSPSLFVLFSTLPHRHLDRAWHGKVPKNYYMLSASIIATTTTTQKRIHTHIPGTRYGT